METSTARRKRPMPLGVPQRPPLRKLWRLIERQKLGTFAALLMAGVAFTAVAAPWLAPYEAERTIDAPFISPSGDYWMGTDHLGRDVLSRIIYAAQISIIAGLGAVFLSVLLGVPVGLVSGYFGGWVDMLVQRIVDILISLPALVLALVLVAVLGPGLRNVIIAIAIVQGPRVSRVIRSSVLSITTEAYVDAARATGCTQWRIMMRHVLPNTFPVILTLASSLVGLAIIVEAALSFLGLGVLPPTPSWGQMLSTSSQQYFINYPWLAIWPGLAIVITVLAANLLGDAIQEIVDPRLRGKR